MEKKRIRFGVTNKLNSIVYLWQGCNSCRAAKRSIPFIPFGNSCRAAKRLLFRRRGRKKRRFWSGLRNDSSHGVGRIRIIENCDALQVDRVKMDSLLHPSGRLVLKNWLKRRTTTRRRAKRLSRRRNSRSGGRLSHTSYTDPTQCCVELGERRANLLRGERGER